ncbi:hypothetical protein LPW11_06230 [Geomonas sp. RF6]|uniref:hypothetical protein n=1 Tax=Geomonas sp. RF6 TaxID=2897342 RepID=UPI001E613A25|nr:hypothetical protein [Geomonas sp. RF6]UFS71787.1 hypothetical protein LPW11_06230 [Geomonas sp. RF6]
MRIVICMLFILSLLWAAPGTAEVRGVAETEVLHDFEQILDLWRDGKYAELYERTDAGSQGKETFAKKLASAPRRPACCWEKMQDVRVSVKNDRAAVVHVRLGLEGEVPGVEYVTKAVKLKKEEGTWVISQSELYSLANVSKKKARYKYLPAREK